MALLKKYRRISILLTLVFILILTGLSVGVFPVISQSDEGGQPFVLSGSVVTLEEDTTGELIELPIPDFPLTLNLKSSDGAYVTSESVSTNSLGRFEFSPLFHEVNLKIVADSSKLDDFLVFDKSEQSLTSMEMADLRALGINSKEFLFEAVRKYKISGRVTNAGAGVSDVLVQIDKEDLGTLKFLEYDSTLTDKTGNFYFDVPGRSISASDGQAYVLKVGTAVPGIVFPQFKVIVSDKDVVQHLDGVSSKDLSSLEIVAPKLDSNSGRGRLSSDITFSNSFLIDTNSVLNNDLLYLSDAASGKTGLISQESNSQIVNSQQDAAKAKTVPSHRGYFVEFTEKPLLARYGELLQEIDAQEHIAEKAPPLQRSLEKAYMLHLEQEVPGKLNLHRQKIIDHQKDVAVSINTRAKSRGRKTDLVNLSVIDSNNVLENRLNGIFNTAVNAIFVEATDEEIEDIRKLPGVKSVSRNLRSNIDVQAGSDGMLSYLSNFSEFASSIGADKVWELKKNGQKITGKGIKVAILDTAFELTNPAIAYQQNGSQCSLTSVLQGNCYKIPHTIDFGQSVDMDGDGRFDKCFELVPRSADPNTKQFCEYGESPPNGRVFNRDKNGNGVRENECYIDTGDPTLCTGNIFSSRFFPELDRDVRPVPVTSGSTASSAVHGTRVAMILGGNIGQVQGVAPDVQLYLYSFLEPDIGGGVYPDEEKFVDYLRIIAALETAVDPWGNGTLNDRADVVNLSLGGWPGSSADLFSQAVDNISSSGTVVATAAGNAGPQGFQEHIACQTGGFTGSRLSICLQGQSIKAITVGAIGRDDILAGYSSRGPGCALYDQSHPSQCIQEGVNKPDLVALGDGYIPVSPPFLETSTLINSGTSYAAPAVAGAAALYLQANPGTAPADVKQQLMINAKNLPGYALHEQGAGKASIIDTIARKFSLQVTGNGYVTSTSSQSQSFQLDCARGEDACSEYFLVGEIVTLTANPEPNATFERWEGVACQEGSQTLHTCSLAIENAVLAQARFSTTVPFANPNLIVESVVKTGNVNPLIQGDAVGFRVVVKEIGGQAGANGLITVRLRIARIGGTPQQFSSSFSDLGPLRSREVLFPDIWTAGIDGQYSVEACVIFSGNESNSGDNCRTANVAVVPSWVLKIDNYGTGSGRISTNQSDRPNIVDCRTSCEKRFPQGASIRLFAGPDNGSVFGGWRDYLCSPYNYRECRVTLTENKTLKPVFLRTPVPYGDVDLSGEINSSDVLLAYNHVRGVRTLLPQEAALADLSGEKGVTLGDTNGILQWALCKDHPLGPCIIYNWEDSFLTAGINPGLKIPPTGYPPLDDSLTLDVDIGAQNKVIEDLGYTSLTQKDWEYTGTNPSSAIVHRVDVASPNSYLYVNHFNGTYQDIYRVSKSDFAINPVSQLHRPFERCAPEFPVCSNSSQVNCCGGATGYFGQRGWDDLRQVATLSPGSNYMYVTARFNHPSYSSSSYYLFKFDISNPTAPVLYRATRLGGTPYRMAVTDNGVFVLRVMEDGQLYLSRYSLTVDGPETVPFPQTRLNHQLICNGCITPTWFRMELLESTATDPKDYLYIGYRFGGKQYLDVYDISFTNQQSLFRYNQFILGSFITSNGLTFSKDGRHLYVGMNKAIRVFDISNRTALPFKKILGDFPGQHITTILAVEDSLILTSQGKLFQYDILNPIDPVLVGERPFNGEGTTNAESNLIFDFGRQDSSSWPLYLMDNRGPSKSGFIRAIENFVLPRAPIVKSCSVDDACSAEGIALSTVDRNGKVNLSVARTSRGTFTHWSGEECNGKTGYQCVVKMDRVKNIRPNFSDAPLRFGDVNNDGAVNATDALAALRIAVGLDSIDSDAAKFRRTDVTLDGNISATDALAILKASVGSVNLPVVTPPPLPLLVSVVGEGKVIATSSTSTAQVVNWCQDLGNCGVIDLDVPETMTFVPEPTSGFLHWAGACSGTGNCTVTINEAKEIIAVFDTDETMEPPLSTGATFIVEEEIVSEPIVDVMGDINHDGKLDKDDALQGIRYVKGEIEGANSLDFTLLDVNEDGKFDFTDISLLLRSLDGREVLPVGTSWQYSFQISKTGEGSGEITSIQLPILERRYCGTECGEIYLSRPETITLKAEADNGSVFVGWKGDCAGAGRTCNVTIDRPISAEVIFEKVVGTGPDLLVESIRTSPRRVTAGRAVSIVSKLKNIGPSVASNFKNTINVDLYSDGLWDLRADYLTSKDVKATKGRSAMKWKKLFVAAPGEHSIEVCAHTDNAVPSETRKGNNCNYTRIIVEDPETINEAPRFARTLSVGATGDEVQLLQKFLSDEKFYDGSINGSYSDQTKNAVISFQESFAEDVLEPRGLTVGSGLWDKETIALANEQLGYIITVCKDEEAPPGYNMCGAAYKDTNYYCDSQLYKHRVKNCQIVPTETSGADLITICNSESTPEGYECGDYYNNDDYTCSGQGAYSHRVKDCIKISGTKSSDTTTTTTTTSSTTTTAPVMSSTTNTTTTSITTTTLACVTICNSATAPSGYTCGDSFTGAVYCSSQAYKYRNKTCCKN